MRQLPTPTPSTPLPTAEPSTAKPGNSSNTRSDSTIRVSKANTKQFGPKTRIRLLESLEDANARGAYPAAPKIEPDWNGREVTLPLKD